MNKFDLKTAKFIGISLFMCLIFALIVMKAYQYLPEENYRQNFKEEYIDNEIQYKKYNHDEDNKTSQEENETYKEEDNKTTNNSQEKANEKRKPFIELESIEEISNNSENNDDQSSILELADKHKQNKDYQNAIEHYKRAAADTDEKTFAYCCEQIATIYAIEKRYGTALSYAQKAYNTYPTTQREMLLARLYYKTGSTDKANERVNNILKRDFEQDR